MGFVISHSSEYLEQIPSVKFSSKLVPLVFVGGVALKKRICAYVIVPGTFALCASSGGHFGIPRWRWDQAEGL